MSRLHGLLGTIVFISLLAAIVAIGQNNSLAAVIGSFGLAASLSFQATLANMWAGVRIRSERKIRVGCVVTVTGPEGPYTGTITSIDIQTTTLCGEDDREALVNNSQLTSATILIGKKEQL